MPPKFYAVANGRSTGVYSDWSSCESQVKGYSNSSYKSFSTLAEAQAFAGGGSSSSSSSSGSSGGGYGSRAAAPSYSSAPSRSNYTPSYAYSASYANPTSVPAPTSSYTSRAATAAASSAAASYAHAAAPSAAPSYSSSSSYASRAPKASAEAEERAQLKSSTKHRNGLSLSNAAQSAQFEADCLREGRVVAFVDGASKGNPGHGGAGVVVKAPKHEGKEFVEATAAYGFGKSTNNYNELRAFESALDIVGKLHKDESGGAAAGGSRSSSVTGTGLSGRKVEVFTDSKWVKGIMAEGWKPQEPSLIPHIERTKETLATLERAGAEVHVHWVKGHADIAGNETADRLANIGAAASAAAGDTDRRETPLAAVAPSYVSRPMPGKKP